MTVKHQTLCERTDTAQCLRGVIWQNPSNLKRYTAAPLRTSSASCKLKQQRGALTHPLEGPKSGTPTAPSADEDVEPPELSLTDGGNAERTAGVDGNLEVSYKTKHPLTVRSSSHTPGHLSEEAEHLCPRENLHPDVYSHFIHHC